MLGLGGLNGRLHVSLGSLAKPTSDTNIVVTRVILASEVTNDGRNPVSTHVAIQVLACQGPSTDLACDCRNLKRHAVALFAQAMGLRSVLLCLLVFELSVLSSEL